MANTQHEVEAYVSHLAFPASKEELINGLLAGDAPVRMVALVERLPRARYANRQRLREDLEEVSRIHAGEVAAAHTYDDYLAVVVRHIGDPQHVTKDAFNRVVALVIHSAQQHGSLDQAGAEAMRQRLEAAFVGLRDTMTEVYDNEAPINPWDDLPNLQG
ncbi:MAG: DUF2795 domain-containing protein [Chloroflexota bacterium]